MQRLGTDIDLPCAVTSIVEGTLRTSTTSPIDSCSRAMFPGGRRASFSRMNSTEGGTPVVPFGSELQLRSTSATTSATPASPSNSPWKALILFRNLLDDSTLPFVCGVRGRASLTSKPASLAKENTLSTLTRLPPETTTSALMLSVSHSSATPPSLHIVTYMHLSRSSVVLVREYTKTCLRDQERVAANTLNSKTSPERSARASDSFQSNWSCSPGGVSNLGWGSRAGHAPTDTPCLRMKAVSALYPGRPSSGYLWTSSSYIPAFVTPGRAAFSTISSRCGSKALPRPDLPSPGSQPSASQYDATVCLFSPYLLAMSLKLGLIPASLYMFSSPVRFLSNPRPFRRVRYDAQETSGAVGETGGRTLAGLAHLRWRNWRVCVCGIGGFYISANTKDLARRDDDAPYRRLADEVAAAFSDEGFAAEKVEDFLATSRALLGRRSSEGFAEAFLTHLVGCCIAEPGSYALELDSLCAMDPAAYQQAFGTLAPDDEPAQGDVAGGAGGGEARQPSLALEVGRFVEAGPVGSPGEAARAVYYVPGAAGARHAYPLLPGEPYTVAVGRHPERDGRSLALGDADRCVSMEHLFLHVRRDGRDASVRLEDWSTCGTVVLRQREAGGFDELRLGAFVEGGGEDGARFAGRKALGRRLEAAEMPELLDGDVVVPAPRYRVGPDGSPVLDLAGCPVAIRVSREG